MRFIHFLRRMMVPQRELDDGVVTYMVATGSISQ